MMMNAFTLVSVCFMLSGVCGNLFFAAYNVFCPARRAIIRCVCRFVNERFSALAD